MEKIKKKSIILIGAGGHAESCINLFNEQSKFALRKIIGKKRRDKKKIILKNYKIKFCDDSLKDLAKKYTYVYRSRSN